MNPFVEYIRAAVDLVAESFSYESVFRLLRCGITDITEEETDRLENYVVAMGIRGFAAWNREWVRTYRGQSPEECVLLNELSPGLWICGTPFYTEMRKKGASITDYAKALYQIIPAAAIFRKKCGVMRKNFARKRICPW